MSLIRAGAAHDLAQIAAIQAASPEAAQWDPADYLRHELCVCVEDGRVAGFAVSRKTAPDECELLNLAVSPEFRRRDVGRRLTESLIKTHKTGTELSVFLEVRESNHAARQFYKRLGFQEVKVRRNYYDDPLESAIVMKFHSC
jgi:ribosomal-protein-alanine acetyltransferase